jgi:predicted amidohydrolase
MAKPLTLAAAQSASVPGDIEANVAGHLRFAERAARQGVNLLVFPELSLTGYELATAARDAILPDDPRLRPLRDAASATAMTIIVGAPLKAAGRPLLAALIFRPDGAVLSYAKMHLHDGEDAVFQPGDGHVACTIGDTVMVPAICADIGRPTHPEIAATMGAHIYAAGVLITESALAAESAMLEDYARRYGMAAVMANHAAPSGGFASAGRSAIWAPGGERIMRAPGDGERLVIASTRDGAWSGEVLPL